MFSRKKPPEAESDTAAAGQPLWLSKAAACQLISRGQEFLRRQIMPGLSATESRRGAGRGKPLMLDGVAVVRQFVATFAVNDDALLDGPDSPSLERFRRLRGDEIELRLLKELNELQSVSLTRAWMTEAFASIGDVVVELTKLFGRRAGQLLSRAAIRAGQKAIGRHYPPGWKTRITLIGPDGREVGLEQGPWESLDFDEPEEQYEHFCPTCKGQVCGTWAIAPDGQESPIWRCLTINCQWTAPRLRQSEAEAANGSDHDSFTTRPAVEPAPDEPPAPDADAEEAPA